MRAQHQSQEDEAEVEETWQEWISSGNQRSPFSTFPSNLSGSLTFNQCVLHHPMVSGGAAVPQPLIKLFQPGDIGSSRRSNPEPLCVLLAAQHRHQGRGEEGEGATHPRRAAQDGGGQGCLRRRHCPQKPRHRPEE